MVFSFIIMLVVVFFAAGEVSKQNKNFATAFAVMLLGSLVLVQLSTQPNEFGIIIIVVIVGIMTGKLFPKMSNNLLEFWEHY